MSKSSGRLSLVQLGAGLLLGGVFAWVRAQAPDAGAAGPLPAPPAPVAPPQTTFDPGSLRAAGWWWTPRIGLARGRNDNLTLAAPADTVPGSPGPIASDFLMCTPELTAALPQGDNRLELNLRAELTRYDTSPINNTANGEIGLDVMRVVGARTAVAWRASLQDWHDAVGSTDLSLQAANPQHYRSWGAGGVMRHEPDGAAGAAVEVEGTLSGKHYLNDRIITQAADVQTAGLNLRLLTAPVGKSAGTPTPGSTAPGDAEASGHALAELRTQVARYPDAADLSPSLDHVDLRWLLGWQTDPPTAAGAATWTADLKAGLQQRSFSAARPDYSGATWDATAHWDPRPRSSVDLTSSRNAMDSPGDDSDQVVATQWGLSWTELWRQDWRTTLSAQEQDNRYLYRQAGLQPSRNDRMSSLDLGASYDASRNCQLVLRAGWARRRSSVATYAYMRHLVSATVTLAW